MLLEFISGFQPTGSKLLLYHFLAGETFVEFDSQADMKPVNETRRSWGREILPWVFQGAFLLCAGAWIAWLGQGPSPGEQWLGGLALVLAVAATVAGLARNLPIENSIMAAVFVALISGLIQIVGVKTGIPFGPYVYTENLGPRMFHLLPWPMPLLWVVIILNSRGVARLILRPGSKLPNPGLWTIGLTCVLAVVIDFNLEPFAVKVGRFWNWRTLPDVPAWYGAPWVNFLGWIVAVFLVLAFTTPWLINKKPVKSQVPDYYPLSMWLTVNLLLVSANAWRGLWTAAGFGLVAGLIVTAFAVRGARQPESATSSKAGGR